MKKTNNKGFTLIELLAVIVIMGILMMVAIPSVSRVIENSRKDTFVDIAKSYANAVKTLWTADGLTCGGTVSSALDPGNYYILINTKDTARVNLPVLVDQGGKSSWGNRDVSGFVRVNITTSGDRRITKFYVSLTDGTHGIIEETSNQLTSDQLKRGNVKMALTAAELKKVQLSNDTNGSLKSASEISPVVAITGSACVES